jgi:Trypsin-like peptidase domain
MSYFLILGRFFYKIMQIKIDPFSCVVSMLQMKFNEVSLSSGTCFFWKHGDNRYLVTNWHNLSGIDSITGIHLNSTTGAEPDRLLIDVFFDQNFNDRREATIFLDNEDSPVWLEHPTFGRQVDVACLCLPECIAPHVLAINEPQQPHPTTQIADDVFLIGYPLGISVHQLPIWKRATVASEIQIDIDDLPKFYVDTASTRGMSGSPAIRRSMNGTTEDGSTYNNGSPMTKFLGVYSGRVSPNGDASAQIGIVWKARVIEEIIIGNVRGKKS